MAAAQAGCQNLAVKSNVLWQQMVVAVVEWIVVAGRASTFSPILISRNEQLVRELGRRYHSRFEFFGPCCAQLARIG